MIEILRDLESPSYYLALYTKKRFADPWARKIEIHRYKYTPNFMLVITSGYKWILSSCSVLFYIFLIFFSDHKLFTNQGCKKVFAL